MNRAFVLLRREGSRKLDTHGQLSGTMLLVIKKTAKPGCCADNDSPTRTLYSLVIGRKILVTPAGH